MKILRKEFYLLVKEVGFDAAVARYNSVLRNHGYQDLPRSDWGKFLQGSPTRMLRQVTKKVRKLMPRVFPHVCHSTRVCWASGRLCDDNGCSVKA